VAQQISCIQNAKTKHATKFFFEDIELSLKGTTNVFITMNPSYAGRSEIPGNLKRLFRFVSIMVPDYQAIA
jgi:dynein heavy chain